MSIRFVESLNMRLLSEPPTAEELSEAFQAFYLRSGSVISIHVSNLKLKLSREASPAPSRSGLSGRNINRDLIRGSTETAGKASGSQQMLTASEVYERKRARKLLEYKRLVLEEAVERKTCERVYDKIWRHKSTLDEVRDEKLRSKTAALALVGIGLRDLGIEVDANGLHTPEDVQESLTPAREELSKMTVERHPLAKLQHLTRAHKSIVDTLYNIHSSTSSADEILPTLIYTLITSPFEGIDIISNLNFIQRFRNLAKIDGEAAYCLTNLEAAITFLEDVDLASLREDEAAATVHDFASGSPTPDIAIQASTSIVAPTSPKASEATTGMNKSTVAATSLLVPERTAQTDILTQPSVRHQRALSNLFQPPARVIGAANDAMRSSAEEGLKNISTTLDNSFKFLFGRLREQSEQDGDASIEVIVPKTLDEARQLVSKPLIDADTLLSETSSLAEKEAENKGDPGFTEASDDKLLSLLAGSAAGKKSAPLRDQSVDSIRSSGSGPSRRTTANAHNTVEDKVKPGPKSIPMSAHMPMPNPLDSVRNLGTTLGSAFGGGFRAAFSSSPTPTTQERSGTHMGPDVAVVGNIIAVQRSVAGETLHIEPPIARFVELEHAEDLTIRDVAELLRDYKRLAQTIQYLS